MGRIVKASQIVLLKRYRVLMFMRTGPTLFKPRIVDAFALSREEAAAMATKRAKLLGFETRGIISIEEVARRGSN